MSAAYTPSSKEADVREWRGIGVVGYESVLGGLYKNGSTCESVGGVARALVRLQDVANRYDALIAALEDIRDIIADKTYPDHETRMSDIAAAIERATLRTAKEST